MTLLMIIVCMVFILGAFIAVYSLREGDNLIGVGVGVFLALVSLFVAYVSYSSPPEVTMTDIPYCIDESSDAGK